MDDYSSGRRKLAMAIVAPWLILQVACAGSEPQDRGAETTSVQPGASLPAAATPVPATGAPGSDAQTIALGKSIFTGQTGGGTCSSCHGVDAKGTPMAPDLTDSQWLNVDGTYESILKIITTGVSQPKKSSEVMPPMGGAQLAPEHVRAVASYVYSLSR